MGRRKIKVYDIQFGQVVYGRIDDKVMAMKLVEISSNKGGSCNYSTFECADETIRKFNMFEPKPLFNTIDDCINNVNEIKSYYKDFSPILIEDIGFSFKRHPLGCTILSYTKYYWDGYEVKSIDISHSCYDIYIDKNGIMCVTNSSYNTYYGNFKYKLYDSYEKCKQDNVIQVVTF